MKVPRSILLTIAAATGWFNAHAQLGETNVDGLRANVRGIYLTGDTRHPDCDVHLNFTGEKVAGAVKMSPLRLVRAVDDTGADLLRTNSPSPENDAYSPGRIFDGFTQIIRLMAPSTDAKAIKSLEGEAEVFTLMTNPPVFAKFKEQSGGIFHQAMLDQYQVTLSYQIHELTNGLIIPPDKKIEFQLNDPQGKVVNLVLQKADGTLIHEISTSRSAANPHSSSIWYNLSGVPARDLKLSVNLATPECTRKIRFSLENVRLPWIEPVNLTVTAMDFTKLKVRATNLFAGQLRLIFAGGRVSNSAGIRNLSISRAESESGQNFKVRDESGWIMSGFSEVMGTGAGRIADKWVPLEIATNSVKSIRILEGEAECCFPNLTNHGILEFKGFLDHSNEPLHDDALSRYGATITFMGRDNFEARKKDWMTQGSFSTSGTLPPGATANVQNSLLFRIDDPEKRVIKIEFVNQKGELLLPPAQMSSTGTAALTTMRDQLYAFYAPLPDETRLRIYLATPESLEKIKFKVENIPL